MRIKREHDKLAKQGKLRGDYWGPDDCLILRKTSQSSGVPASVLGCSWRACSRVTKAFDQDDAAELL